MTIDNNNDVKSGVSEPTSRLKVFTSSILGPALIIQLAPALGFFVVGAVSIFYYFVKDPRFPAEQPIIPILFGIFNLILFLIGTLIQKQLPPKETISLRRGAWIVFVVWVIACSVSAWYFVVNGFPIPDKVGDFSLLRRFVDGFYESMSGYTTTGASILPSVEVFPRSLLFWRTMLHWIGGMGIAYLAVTLWDKFASSRQAVINSETEAHEIVEFESQTQARQSGFDFLKAYGLLTLAMFILLLASGFLFRIAPYQNWYDNVFDSVTHTMTTLGTGGFGTYDLSAGLPSSIDNGNIIIGGLQNKVSEWIITFFMIFSGINFSLWYLIFFGKDKKSVFKNTEHRAYWTYILLCGFGIAYFLYQKGIYNSVEETLRYAFFNVASVVSTTGLGNWDFNIWPSSAIGILFIAYIVGSMVGSTGGGPKVIRFIVFYKFIKQQIHNTVYGENQDGFNIDGLQYTIKKASLVIATIGLYYGAFLIGVIALLVLSPTTKLVDGTQVILGFDTAISASIANLGNIGPGISSGSGLNIGPTGNYFAFSVPGKLILCLLMYIGRVGILAVIMLFLKSRGEQQFTSSVMSVRFDPEKPVLRQ